MNSFDNWRFCFIVFKRGIKLFTMLVDLNKLVVHIITRVMSLRIHVYMFVSLLFFLNENTHPGVGRGFQSVLFWNLSLCFCWWFWNCRRRSELQLWLFTFFPRTRSDSKIALLCMLKTVLQYISSPCWQFNSSASNIWREFSFLWLWRSDTIFHSRAEENSRGVSGGFLFVNQYIS